MAKQIQDILVENKMTMVPSISIGMNEDRTDGPIAVPEKGKILTQEDIEKEKAENPLFQADFMQE